MPMKVQEIQEPPLARTDYMSIQFSLLQLVAILECPLNPSGTVLATSLLICGQVTFAQSRSHSSNLSKLGLLIKLLTSFSLLQKRI